jgi:hypothetical protein
MTSRAKARARASSWASGCFRLSAMYAGHSAGSLIAARRMKISIGFDGAP